MSIYRIVMLYSDLKKSACLWSGISDDLWGIDTVSPPTQNADGLENWMSGSYGNSSTTWMCRRKRKCEEKSLNNKDCCVTVTYVSLSSLIRSSRASDKYIFWNWDQTNNVIFVLDIQLYLKIQSGNERVVASQILIKFWLSVPVH